MPILLPARPKPGKALAIAARVILILALLWGGLTIWVQFAGPQRVVWIGKEDNPRKALIVYNPDPIYSLDEQVGRAFAEGLAEQGFSSRLATLKRADDHDADYQLYVFCANTYNWAPDWKTTQYIEGHPERAGQPAAAITLGSGSTARAKRLLEEQVTRHGMRLLGSRTYWLMRPNDESRPDEDNVEVAVDLARRFGREIGALVNDQ